MRVLMVCSANICRSPSAEWALRDAAAAHPELAGIEVRSAGTQAIVGLPGCRVAPALAGRWAEHESRPLDEDLVAWADLILTASREHGAAVAALDPRARQRTLTLRQAARVADWLIDAGMVGAAMAKAGIEPTLQGQLGRDRTGGDQARRDQAGRDRPGREGASVWDPVKTGLSEPLAGGSASEKSISADDPRAAVPPIPATPTDRWSWIVTELDAGRGLAARPGASPPPAERRRWRWAGGRGAPEPAQGAPSPDDIPDPHVLGMELHEVAAAQVQGAVASLVRLFAAVQVPGAWRGDGAGTEEGRSG